MRSSASPPGLTTGGSSRFSSTLRLENTPRSSGQKATPARAIWSELRLINSSPRKRTEPARWPTMPMIDFSVVVLPAPLRPSSVTTSPSCTSNVTPWRICDSPYHACRSLTASSGMRTSSMAHPHVSLTHFRIGGDGVVVAFRQYAPACEHGDVIGEIRDDRKIMLDHQNRAVGRDPLDQLRNAVDVLMAHARRRLVEKQHLRIECQRCGNLQRSLAAVRKFDRHPVGDRGEPDLGNQLHGPFVQIVEH